MGFETLVYIIGEHTEVDKTYQVPGKKDSNNLLLG